MNVKNESTIVVHQNLGVPTRTRWRGANGDPRSGGQASCQRSCSRFRSEPDACRCVDVQSPSSASFAFGVYLAEPTSPALEQSNAHAWAVLMRASCRAWSYTYYPIGNVPHGRTLYAPRRARVAIIR